MDELLGHWMVKARGKTDGCTKPSCLYSTELRRRNRLLKDKIRFYFVPVLRSLFSRPSQDDYFPVSCERL